MAKNKLKFSAYLFSAIILTLGISISFQSLLADFTPPSNNPPTCPAGSPGCDAPLNVGPTNQQKQGMLLLNTAGNTNGLIVQSGNVGIGTISPGYKLDIAGSLGGSSQSVTKYLEQGRNVTPWDQTFEENITGWSSINTTSFTQSSDQAYEGSYSLKIQRDNLTGSGGIQYNLGNSLKPGRVYTLSGYYKMVNGSGTANVRLVSNSTTSYTSGTTSTSKTLQNSSDWTFFSVSVTASTITSGNNNFVWLAYSMPNTTQEIYFDNLVFAEGSLTKTEFANMRTSIDGTKTYFGGSVGIGTASPRGKLEIYNTAITSDGDGSSTQTASGQDSIILYGHGGVNEQTYGGITWMGGNRRRAMITAASENADSDHIGLAFYTQGTDGVGDFYESMRISRGGNVGIGTTAPGQLLDVRGNIDLTGDVYMDNNQAVRIDSNAHTNLILGNFNDGGFAYGGTYNLNLAVEGDVKANRFCIGDADCKSDWTSIGGASGWTDDGTTVRLTTASDKVGIGTASPGAKLDVRGIVSGGSPFIAAHFGNDLGYGSGSGSGPVWLSLGRNALTHGYVEAGSTSPTNSADGYLAFGTRRPVNDIQEAMRIDKNGNVGIGTTAPGSKLVLDLDGTGKTLSFGDWSGNYASYGWGITGALDKFRLPSLVYFGNSSFFFQKSGNNGLFATYDDFDIQTYNGSYGSRLKITKTGNVGIGTTAPGQKLDVRGNIDLTGDVYMDTNKAIRIDANSHTNLILGNFNDGAFAYGGTYNLNLAVEGDVKANRFCIGDADCKSDWTSIGGASGWTDDGTTVRLTTASDNVGIGTASPGQKLDVSGNIRASGEIISTTYNAFRAVAPNYGIFLRNDNVNTYMLLTNNGDSYGTWNTLRPFRIENSTGNVYLGNNAFTVNHGGNVGIGTTAPGYKLDIFSASSATAYSSNWSNYLPTKAEARIVNPVSNASATSNGEYSGLLLQTGNSIGIGTAMVSVVETGTSGYGASLTFQTRENNSPNNLREWMRINDEGNVGVGTTAPGYKLHVNGTVYASQYYGGACDIAERYNADDEEKGDLEPGDILSLSRSGDLKVGKSKQAYDTMVIGVFSTDPMLTMGEFEDSNDEDNPPVALLGRVPTKVTNENGPIEIGDLIVSSSKEGHGMKCDEYSKCQGAVVGKALENFNGEEGVIEVLINVGM